MNPYSCRNPCTLVTVMITCLLLAGIPAAMAADGTTALPSPGSNISVITFPRGAAVYLNDEYRGDTPITIEYLSPGKYVVDVRMNGYRNETIQRTLTEGSKHEIGINLEPLTSVTVSPGKGSVAIDSSPGGASVMLDGKPVGTTPAGHAALILNDVPTGSHTVTVALTGYPVYTSTVTVIKNQVVRVNAGFEVQSPTIPGTPIATTDRPEPVPLSPLSAVAAAGLIGLGAVFRRS
jgi:hypothetical protein